MHAAASRRLPFLLSAALVIGGCKPSPRSDPTTPRKDKAYREAAAPEPPARRTNSAFGQITISNDVSEILIRRPGAPVLQANTDGQSHQTRRLAPGEIMAGSNAAFKVIAYGVWLPSAPKTNGLGHPTYDIYAPDGKPMGPADQKRIGLDAQRTRVWDRQKCFPDLRVWFGDTNHPPGFIRPVAVFDARTRAQLTSGASYGQVFADYPGNVRFELDAWLPTPLEMVVDVELEGKVVREVDVVPGSRHDLPGGEVFFAGLWNGDANSTSSRNDGSSEFVTIGLRKDEDELRTSAIFLAEPPELAVHLELLGANGKVLDGGGGMTSGNVRILTLRTNATAIARIRLSVFTNHYRVVVPIPPLAGLPRENQNPRDLFEIRIPRVELRDAYELRRLIGKATQMAFHYSATNTFPPGFFPCTLTNVTPGELLDLHRRILGPGQTFVVDRENQEIRLEEPPLHKAWLWLKKTAGLK